MGKWEEHIHGYMEVVGPGITEQVCVETFARANRIKDSDLIGKVAVELADQFFSGVARWQLN